jgi:hypothetical protein
LPAISVRALAGLPAIHSLLDFRIWPTGVARLDREIRTALRPPLWCLALSLVLIAVGLLHASRSGASDLTLESFFLGKLHGGGESQDPEHGERTVNFSGFGTAIPGGLELSYDIAFSDGERQHKVWTFLKAGQGRYIGRRTDVVGDAQLVQSGRDIQLTYTAHVPTKEGVKDLSFDEHFTLTGGGTIVNQLTANFLFLDVASAQVTIHRASGSASR